PFRTAVLEALERDIVGPYTEDEILDDAPITQYLSGILYPQGQLVEGDQDEADEVESYAAPERNDPAVALANVRYPSSMGITFTEDGGYKGDLILHVMAGRYLQLEDDNVVEDMSLKRRERIAKKWQRYTPVIEDVRLPMDNLISGRRLLTDGLELY